MIRAGVSSACLYPMLLENSVEELVINGINTLEIFFNTHSEMEYKFVKMLSDILKGYDAKCKSVHPYSCAMEPMMFFSGYERRVDDILDYYKKYFEAMNILGAEIFVFHGNKDGMGTLRELYFQRFERLVDLGEEFGITVAQENVSRCQSRSLDFMQEMTENLGRKAKFVIDVKQAIRSEENPFEIIDKLDTHIVHIHMSDHGEAGDCLPLGKGDFDIKNFIEKLEEKNYDGAVILELYRSNFSNINDLKSNFNTLKHFINH